MYSVTGSRNKRGCAFLHVYKPQWTLLFILVVEFRNLRNWKYICLQWYIIIRIESRFNAVFHCIIQLLYLKQFQFQCSFSFISSFKIFIWRTSLIDISVLLRGLYLILQLLQNVILVKLNLNYKTTSSNIILHVTLFSHKAKSGFPIVLHFLLIQQYLYCMHIEILILFSLLHIYDS